MCLYIMGLHLDHRSQRAPRVQEVLTGYGHHILGRFGIPDPNKEGGLITLVLEAGPETVDSLACDLTAIPGVRVNSMPMG